MIKYKMFVTYILNNGGMRGNNNSVVVGNFKWENDSLKCEKDIDEYNLDNYNLEIDIKYISMSGYLMVEDKYLRTSGDWIKPTEDEYEASKYTILKFDSTLTTNVFYCIKDIKSNQYLYVDSDCWINVKKSGSDLRLKKLEEIN